jgi:hypothetical protein
LRVDNPDDLAEDLCWSIAKAAKQVLNLKRCSEALKIRFKPQTVSGEQAAALYYAYKHFPHRIPYANNIQ